MTVTRLTAGDWVDAGFTVLGAEGIQGLKIDRMAERLNVTKGSFYWHFRDLDDFLDAMAAHWAAEMGTRFLATAGGPSEHPAVRMQKRLRVFLSRSVRSLDRAMRQWALRDPRARTALEATDRQIYAQMTADLRELGFPETEAAWRASILFYASVGYAAVDHPLTETSLREEGLKLLRQLSSRD